ncbi:MAG: hypothetical protein HUJ97_01020 [Bacteroidales bacterium]|nr:hypothetical protein [Bacteroidales bacterium]
MKRLGVMFAIMATVAISAVAQSEDNVFFKCTPGNITYTTPKETRSSGAATAAKIIGSILEAGVGQNTQTTHHPEFADAVSKAIAGGINYSRRFSVIDGGLSQNDLDAHVPALYYDGTISSITTTRRFRTEKDKDGKIHNYTEFMGNVAVTFDLKDEYTGRVIKTVNLNSAAISEWWFASEEKALSYAISKMQSQITKDLDLSFPLHANIIEKNAIKGDKIKSLYIDLGSNAGVDVGLYLLVERVQMIGGKKAKKEIGRLRVLEVLGEEISLCKITHGGAEIKKALDAKETLQITSQNVSDWFGN